MWPDLQPKTPVVISVLFVLVKGSGIVDKISMAVHALFFIALSCVEDFTMGHHGSPFIRNIEDISVAFQALIVLKRGICLFTIFFVIIFILDEMDNDVFDPVGRL
jgi:hypothetical protein